jgi:hypothetical protein
LILVKAMVTLLYTDMQNDLTGYCEQTESNVKHCFCEPVGSLWLAISASLTRSYVHRRGGG